LNLSPGANDYVMEPAERNAGALRAEKMKQYLRDKYSGASASTGAGGVSASSKPVSSPDPASCPTVCTPSIPQPLMSGTTSATATSQTDLSAAAVRSPPSSVLEAPHSTATVVGSDTDSSHVSGLQSLEAKLGEMKIAETEKQKYREVYLKVEAEAERDMRKRLTTDDFEPLAIIGRGAFGEVRLVRMRDHLSKEVYAMKSMLKEAMIMKNQVSNASVECSVLFFSVLFCSVLFCSGADNCSLRALVFFLFIASNRILILL
jgi:hypothetical protein